MAKSVKLNNNTYLDSSSIVHQRTKLSDILNFSENETKIGVDGNGNSVYRKTVKSVMKNITQPAWQTINHNISNVDKIAVLCGHFDYNNETHSIPNADVILEVKANKTQIVYYKQNIGLDGCEIRFVLVYTKK